MKDSVIGILRKDRLWVAALLSALVFKFGLLMLIALTNPKSFMEFDSIGYFSCAQTLADFFAGQGTLRSYDIFRTPGYPFFLMVFHHWLRIPEVGIVFLHMCLNVLAAWIVAKAAERINPKLVPLSALIILLDLPITIFSLLLMTEALFLVEMSVFLWAAIRYIQQPRWRWLVLASLMVAAAVFTRPVAYYLPLMLGGLGFLFLIRQPQTRWKAFAHAAVFLAVAYGLIFSWQYHNYKTIGRFTFSSIDNATVKMHGLIGRYARGDVSNKVDAKSMDPVTYYVYTTSRHVFDLMTEPGSFKYFGSDSLKKMGKVAGYLEIFLWLPAFLVGAYALRKDTYGRMMLLVVFYFMTITILAVGWETTPRFRVPMMPFIAIIAAHGWLVLAETLHRPKTLEKKSR